MDKSLLTVPPKTAIGKALVYLSNQWDKLALFSASLVTRGMLARCSTLAVFLSMPDIQDHDLI